MPITNLQYTDTFKTWFDRTNTVITTLNGVTVYNIVAGDGISASGVNGIFTIQHSPQVNTGVTFNGNVNFAGTVSFSASPTISTTTIAVTPKSTGLTAGNVVRATATGLTFAKADSAANAEVLGIVVTETGNANIVAVSGSINNTLFPYTFKNLGVITNTLTAGQAYFLDPVVAGGITTIEPQTYGQVSRPVLLGITGDNASYLPYRGVLIEGISAGITAELDNKVIISLNYSSFASSSTITENEIKVGDLLLLSRNSAEIGDLAERIKYAGILNDGASDLCYVPDFNTTLPFNNIDYLTGPRLVGIISKILSHDISSDVYLLEITTYGGIFSAKSTEFESVFYTDLTKSSPLYLTQENTGSSIIVKSIPIEESTSQKFCDIIRINDADDTIKVIFNKTQDPGFGTAVRNTLFSSATTSITAASVVEYDNLIPNGSFAIWQKGIDSITAGSLQTYSTSFGDNWFITKNNPTGLSLSFSRQSFNSDQTEVPGSPLYYVNTNLQFSTPGSTSERTRYENVQREARLLQGQDATIQFWAKSTVSGSTLDLIYNQYKDSYSSNAEKETALQSRGEIQTGITLSTAWKRYTYNFTPNSTYDLAGFTLSPSEKGWFSVGFEFPSSSATVSLAQVQVELGDEASLPVYMPPEQELERCKPYYLRTYDYDQNNGFTGSSRLNEYILQLGNLVTQRTYQIKFPIQMVQTPTTYKIYSPSGTENDAYNQNIGADMRYSGNTETNKVVNLPWDFSTVRTTASWPSEKNILISSVNKYGMTVRINNGATHLDTIKFHYVIDAGFDIN